MAGDASTPLPTSDPQDDLSISAWLEQQKDEALASARKNYNEYLAPTVDSYLAKAESAYDEYVQPSVDEAELQYILAQQTIALAIQSQDSQSLLDTARRYGPVALSLATGNISSVAQGFVVDQAVDYAPEVVEGWQTVVAIGERAVPLVWESAKRFYHAEDGQGMAEVDKYWQSDCPECHEALVTTTETYAGVTEAIKNGDYGKAWETAKKGTEQVACQAQVFVAKATGEGPPQYECEGEMGDGLISLVTVEDQSDLTDQSDGSDVPEKTTEGPEQVAPEAVLVSNTTAQTPTAIFEEAQDVELVQADVDDSEGATTCALSSSECDEDEETEDLKSDQDAVVLGDVVPEEGAESSDTKTYIADASVDPAADEDDDASRSTLVVADSINQAEEVLTGLTPVGSSLNVGGDVGSETADGSSIAWESVLASRQTEFNSATTVRSRTSDLQVGTHHTASRAETVAVAAGRTVDGLLGFGPAVLIASFGSFGRQTTTYLQQLVDAQAVCRRSPDELNDPRIVAGFAVFQFLRGHTLIDEGVVASLDRESAGDRLFTVTSNSTTGQGSNGAFDPQSGLVSAIAMADDVSGLSTEEPVDLSRQVSLREIIQSTATRSVDVILV